MDMKEKLVELLNEKQYHGMAPWAHGMQSIGNEEIADHLIAHGVTAQEWISVKDRLPDQGQQVIVYSGNILSPSVFAYQFWNKDYDSWAHITHWMPLPDAPKGE